MTLSLLNAKQPALAISQMNICPLAPRTAADFKNLRKAFSAIETEIYYLPEFYYWDGAEPESIGCNYGGTLALAPTTRAQRPISH